MMKFDELVQDIEMLFVLGSLMLKSDGIFLVEFE